MGERINGTSEGTNMPVIGPEKDFCQVCIAFFSCVSHTISHMVHNEYIMSLGLADSQADPIILLSPGWLMRGE